MALIYEARHFILKTLDQPHVSRSDGGHVVIDPKVAVDRTLRPKPSIKFLRSC